MLVVLFGLLGFAGYLLELIVGSVNRVESHANRGSFGDDRRVPDHLGDLADEAGTVSNIFEDLSEEVGLSVSMRGSVSKRKGDSAFIVVVAINLSRFDRILAVEKLVNLGLAHALDWRSVDSIQEGLSVNMVEL